MLKFALSKYLRKIKFLSSKTNIWFDLDLTWCGLAWSLIFRISKAFVLRYTSLRLTIIIVLILDLLLKPLLAYCWSNVANFHSGVFLLDEYFSLFSSPRKCFFTVNKKGQNCTLTTLASLNSDCLTVVDIECGVHKENSGWVLSKHRKAFDFGRRMVKMNHVKKHSWLVVLVVIMMGVRTGLVQRYYEIGCVQVIWKTTPCNNYTWGTAGLATDGPRVRQTCSCI